MIKGNKILASIVAASFLTFIPVKSYEKDCNVKINTPALKEIKRDLSNYIVSLATDLDDDGKEDKKGYILLFNKIEFKYNESWELEKFQEQIWDYINYIIEDEFKTKEFQTKVWSMLSEKDIEQYYKKTFDEYLPRMIDEVLRIKRDIERK